MTILTDSKMRKVVEKLGKLQLELAGCHARMMRTNEGLGVPCYDTMTEGIMEVINDLAGDKGMEVYSANILPHYMKGFDV